MSTLTRLAAALLLVLASVAGATAAAAQLSSEQADLAVEQPDYVGEEVREKTTNGTTVYVAQSGQLTLKPQNFNTSSVVGYGIETDAGTLTYDEEFDVFRFDADGHTGTFETYFEVRQRVATGTENNTTVETVRRRYTAVLKVEDNQSYVHLREGAYEQEKRDAENWSAFTSSIRDISGADADVQTKAQLALDMLNLRENPAAALSGNFSAILLMMFMTLGGGLVLALFGLLHLGARYTDIKALNRWNSLKSDERSLDERWADLQLEEKKRAIQNKDWNDLYDDDERARAMRDVFGETVYDGVCTLQSMLQPRNIVTDRLRAMGQHNYVGIVERGDVRSDGGETDGEADTEPLGPIVSADLRRETDAEDIAEENRIDLTTSGEDFEAFVDALDFSHDELLAFDLARRDVDGTQMVTKCRIMELEELMTEMDTQRLDFENPDEFGRLLFEFIESVRESDYCDTAGTPDDLRFVMNQFLQVSQIMSDKERIPLFEFSAQALERALADRSPVEEAESTVDDIRAGKYT